MLWPAGIFSALTLLVVGRLLGWGIDARWLIALGLLIMAAGNYWMVLMNLYISPSQAIWPRVVVIIGLSLMFAPLNVAAFLYIPKHLRGAAVGLLALLRNEGGSFGVSLVQTLQERRIQFHTARAGEFLDPFNPDVSSFLEQARAFFFQQTGDPAGIATDGAANARGPPPAAGCLICFFRRLLGGGGCELGAGVPGVSDEALGGGETLKQEIGR